MGGERSRRCGQRLVQWGGRLLDVSHVSGLAGDVGDGAVGGDVVGEPAVQACDGLLFAEAVLFAKKGSGEGGQFGGGELGAGSAADDGFAGCEYGSCAGVE